MHSFEVNIRICQPEKVMSTEAKPSPGLRLGGHHFLGLTNPDVNLKRMHQLYIVISEKSPWFLMIRYFQLKIQRYSYYCYIHDWTESSLLTVIDFNFGRHKDLSTLKSDIHRGCKAEVNITFAGR